MAYVPLLADDRPTRRGRGGRRYIGPKAQTAVDEELWLRVEAEAANRKCEMSEVWREVIYAGMVATDRATSAEVAALAAVGDE